MIKSKFGPITNLKTGEAKYIIVNSLSLKSFRDILIVGGIVIISITYLTLSSFKNGALAFEEAEFKTLEELNLFKN